MTPEERERALTAIRDAAAAHGAQALARKAKVSRQHLHDVLAGRKTPPDAMLAELAMVVHGLIAGRPRADDVLPAARARCPELGRRRRFARLAGSMTATSAAPSLVRSDRRRLPWLSLPGPCALLQRLLLEPMRRRRMAASVSRLPPSHCGPAERSVP